MMVHCISGCRCGCGQSTLPHTLPERYEATGSTSSTAPCTLHTHVHPPGTLRHRHRGDNQWDPRAGQSSVETSTLCPSAPLFAGTRAPDVVITTGSSYPVGDLRRGCSRRRCEIGAHPQRGDSARQRKTSSASCTLGVPRAQFERQSNR